MSIRYQKIKVICGVLLLGISTVLPAQTPAQNQLLQAETHFFQGHYSLAQNELEHYFRANSPSDKNERPLFFLAECFYHQHEYKKAIPLFQELLRTDTALPFRPRMTLDLGRSYFFTGDLPAAENSLTDVVLDFNNHPIMPETLYWLATTELEQAKYREALSHLYILSSEYPQAAIIDSCFYAIGQIREIRGEHRRAITAYKKVYTDFPDSPLAAHAHFQTGIAAYREHQFDLTVTKIKTALHDYPDHQLVPEALYVLAETYAQQKKFTAAAQSYEQLTQKFPNNILVPDALYGWGWALAQNKNNSLAADIFGRLATQYPRASQTPAALLAAGSCYQHLKQPLFAREQYLNLVQNFPQSKRVPEALYQIGKLDFTEKKYHQSALFLIQIYEKTPTHDLAANACLLAGEAFFQTGDYQNATHWFEKTRGNYSTAPAAETALYFLGRTDIATGQVDSGISRLQDFITGKTDHPYLQPATYWLAEGYYRIKDFTRAQHYYREALMLKPNSHYFIPIHQNLGYCALHLHEYPPAQYHFQQMLLTKTDTQTRQLAEIRFADTIFCQNKFNEAIKLYRKFLTENTASPLVPYARLQLGNTYRGMKLHETAYRQYQQLLTEFPQSSLSDQARYQLAQSNFSLNEFDQATRDFLKIPELYPFSDLADDAVYGAANSCFNGRQYADARKNYEKILQEYPESSLRESALDGLRFTLIKLGRVNEAMRLITAADSVEARFQRARLFVDMKKYNSAISEFNQIVKNDSSSTTAQKTYYHIGQTRQLQKKSDLALNAWEQQVSHYPEAAETPLAIEQLGNYFQGRKQYGRAATYYQKLIDNYPEHPVSWKSGIKLGEIAIMEQDTSLALNSWQSVVAHSSGHVENSQARVEIAKILIAQTRTEAARDMLLPPAESAQNSTAAEAQYLIGESLYADARYPAATAAFLKVKYHYPFLEKWCVQSIFRASEALEEMEEYDEARRFYQEIISNYKDGGYRAKAKRKIQYLKKYEDKNAKK